MQLRIGEAANLPRLALPDDGGFVGAGSKGIAVDAVVAEIELAADEPLGPGQVPVENFVPGLEPVQLARHAGPEFFRIFNGLLVEGLVLFQALNVRLGAELGRRGKDAVFAECGVDVLVGDGVRGQGRHAKSFREEVSKRCAATKKASWREG